MTTHSKLSAADAERIRYLYTIPGWSPLEIAQELGLTFRQVCHFIDKHCLRPVQFMVARDVRKATRADSHIPEDWGFTVPNWRPRCL